MKIRKFNENNSLLLTALENEIFDIIKNEIEMETVPYTNDEQTISFSSIENASKGIIEYLKTKGLLLCLDANKYNL